MTRILALSPKTYGYENRIQQALVQCGYDAAWMDERVGNGFLWKAITRLRLLWMFPHVKRKHVRNITSRILQHNANLLLVINPETLKGADLEYLKRHCPALRIHVYKWDSLTQKPIDPLFVQMADRIFSFDPADCRSNSYLQHLPLFHSHLGQFETNSGNGPKTKDFLFVGTAQFHRIKVLAKIGKKLTLEKRKHTFYLVSQSLVHQLAFKTYAKLCGYKGELSQKPLEYKEYLAQIDASHCVIDIEYPKQSGLTMRTLEVVFSGSCIWTTNASIKEYELENLKGVFYLNLDNIQIPLREEFLCDTEKHLFDDYSIKTWISNIVLGEGHLQWNGEKWVS